jgi:hypothetical protein
LWIKEEKSLKSSSQVSLSDLAPAHPELQIIFKVGEGMSFDEITLSSKFLAETLKTVLSFKFIEAALTKAVAKRPSLPTIR